MAWWLPVTLLGTSALGGLLGGRKSARTWTSQQTTTSEPILSPEYQGLWQKLYEYNLGRLGAGADLGGYEAQGLADINRTYELAGRTLENALTRRGLASSPIAGAADIGLESARGAEAARFLNQLPLLQRQMGMEDYLQALNLLQATPVGWRQTGTGQITYPGSMLGGMIGDLGSMLGWLAGRGLLTSGGTK
jgi:hypothetical protein